MCSYANVPMELVREQVTGGVWIVAMIFGFVDSYSSILWIVRYIIVPYVSIWRGAGCLMLFDLFFVFLKTLDTYVVSGVVVMTFKLFVVFSLYHPFSSDHPQSLFNLFAKSLHCCRFLSWHVWFCSLHINANIIPCNTDPHIRTLHPKPECVAERSNSSLQSLIPYLSLEAWHWSVHPYEK